jgi:hypothetical protein
MSNYGTKIDKALSGGEEIRLAIEQGFLEHALDPQLCHPDGLRFLQAGGPMQSLAA